MLVKHMFSPEFMEHLVPTPCYVDRLLILLHRGHMSLHIIQSDAVCNAAAAPAHTAIGANLVMHATQQFLAVMGVSHVKCKQYAQAHD